MSRWANIKDTSSTNSNLSILIRVQALVECGADLTAINLTDHNPLLEAIARGNREVILAILDSDRWKEAVRSVKMTSAGVKETPVKQLIKRFPDLAKVTRIYHRETLKYNPDCTDSV